jgi:hypothetical protein
VIVDDENLQSSLIFVSEIKAGRVGPLVHLRIEGKFLPTTNTVAYCSKVHIRQKVIK